MTAIIGQWLRNDNMAGNEKWKHAIKYFNVEFAWLHYKKKVNNLDQEFLLND